MESDSEQELKPNRIQVHRDRAQSLMLTCASKANNEPRIKPTLISMSLDKRGCVGKLGENLTKKTKNKSNVFTSPDCRGPERLSFLCLQRLATKIDRGHIKYFSLSFLYPLFSLHSPLSSMKKKQPLSQEQWRVTTSVKVPLTPCLCVTLSLCRETNVLCGRCIFGKRKQRRKLHLLAFWHKQLQNILLFSSC